MSSNHLEICQRCGALALWSFSALSGDLTKRKLIPALLQPGRRKTFFPNNLRLSVLRATIWITESFRKTARPGNAEICPIPLT